MVITFLWQVHPREREGAVEKNFIYSITHNWQWKPYVPEKVKGSWGGGRGGGGGGGGGERKGFHLAIVGN